MKSPREQVPQDRRDQQKTLNIKQGQQNRNPIDDQRLNRRKKTSIKGNKLPKKERERIERAYQERRLRKRVK